EVGDDRKQRSFLAPVLGRGRGEGATDLAVQRALGPESAGLVEEIRHLRSHAAEPGDSAYDDGIIIGKLFDLRHRRCLVQFVMRCFGYSFRHQFRHPLDVDAGAGFARALGDSIRHFFDVTVGGIVKNENFCHVDTRVVCWIEVLGDLGYRQPGNERPYAASTSTSSESCSAVIFSTGSSVMAAPSRVLTRTPLISTAPVAGTR